MDKINDRGLRIPSELDDVSNVCRELLTALLQANPVKRLSLGSVSMEQAKWLQLKVPSHSATVKFVKIVQH